MKQLNKNILPGDLFYIPAMNKTGEYGFVMARYIEDFKGVGCLIEVFAHFYMEPPKSLNEVDKKRRLFRPIACSFAFSEIPRWKILFNDPSYNKSQSDYDNLAIAFPEYFWIGGIRHDATPDQLKGLEKSTCWRMHHIIFRVNAHLAGIFHPNDCYTFHGMPLEMRSDNPEAEAKVFALAQAMDEKFKIWAAQAKKSSKKSLS